MYDPNPDMTRLRQGDVLAILNLPRFKISTTSFLHNMQPDGNFIPQDRAVIDTIPSYAVVLSQCCEFNTNKRSSFSIVSMFSIKEQRLSRSWGINVAELVALAKSPFRPRQGMVDDEIERLRAANTVQGESGRNEALNAYLYSPDGVHLSEHYVADFSRVTSLSMKDMPTILNHKLLQLDDDNRRLFQLKLAYFYARPAR